MRRIWCYMYIYGIFVLLYALLFLQNILYQISDYPSHKGMTTWHNRTSSFPRYKSSDLLASHEHRLLRLSGQTALMHTGIKHDEIQSDTPHNSTRIIEGTLYHSSDDHQLETESQLWLTIYPGRGRLGNQMFQVASLLGIAQTYRYTTFIPSTSFELTSVFDIPKSNSRNLDITRVSRLEEDNSNTFTDRDITRYTDTSVLKLRENWTLDGYFQSFKHFSHIKQDIEKIFTFNARIIEEAGSFIGSNVANNNSVKVGIHVRRGDFLSDYHKGLGRVTPDTDYYRRAMEYYRVHYKDITFLVFSNDMSWCKENIVDNRANIIFSPYLEPGYDLALMSLCDHMIISVGTFGWWGGWLAGGSAVYFLGYPKPGSEIDKYFVKDDFYPSNWLGMA